MNRQHKNHMTSIRLPAEMHQWVVNFADKLDLPSAHIYRSAIKEFMQRQVQS